MRPEDLEAIESFDKAILQMDEFFQFVRTERGQVALGSALEIDDAFWSHHPVSQVIWQALVSSAEHLELLHHTVLNRPTGSLVTAPFSIARGALVASSKALWVAAADTPEDRRQRGLAIAVESLTQRIGYQTEMLKISNEVEQKAIAAQINDLLVPVRQEALGLAKKGYGFTEKSLIKQAALTRFPDKGEAGVVTADLIWRRLGGDAHALGWQLLFGDLTWDPAFPADQLGVVEVRGDINALTQAGMWALTFTKAAVERFQKLAGLSV